MRAASGPRPGDDVRPVRRKRHKTVRLSEALHRSWGRSAGSPRRHTPRFTWLPASGTPLDHVRDQCVAAAQLELARGAYAWRMASCPTCGAEFRREWRHCVACGAPLARRRGNVATVVAVVAGVLVVGGGFPAFYWYAYAERSHSTHGVRFRVSGVGESDMSAAEVRLAGTDWAV